MRENGANKAADDTDYTDEVNHQRYPRHPRLVLDLCIIFGTG
jgi:hypothetical protein